MHDDSKTPRFDVSLHGASAVSLVLLVGEEDRSARLCQVMDAASAERIAEALESMVALNQPADHDDLPSIMYPFDSFDSDVWSIFLWVRLGLREYVMEIASEHAQFGVDLNNDQALHLARQLRDIIARAGDREAA